MNDFSVRLKITSENKNKTKERKERNRTNKLLTNIMSDTSEQKGGMVIVAGIYTYIYIYIYNNNNNNVHLLSAIN